MKYLRSVVVFPPMTSRSVSNIAIERSPDQSSFSLIQSISSVTTKCRASIRPCIFSNVWHSSSPVSLDPCAHHVKVRLAQPVTRVEGNNHSADHRRVSHAIEFGLQRPADGRG